MVHPISHIWCLFLWMFHENDQKYKVCHCYVSRTACRPKFVLSQCMIIQKRFITYTEALTVIWTSFHLHIISISLFTLTLQWTTVLCGHIVSVNILRDFFTAMYENQTEDSIKNQQTSMHNMFPFTKRFFDKKNHIDIR